MADDAATADDDGDDDGGPDPVEIAADMLADECQRRLWLRAIIPLLQLRSHNSDPSPRVQLAYDRMFIAATERAARILGSDLPG
jgi:hypothetical protein